MQRSACSCLNGHSSARVTTSPAALSGASSPGSIRSAQETYFLLFCLSHSTHSLRVFTDLVYTHTLPGNSFGGLEIVVSAPT